MADQERLEEIRARHCVDRSSMHCIFCQGDWPCHTDLWIAEADRLDRLLALARERDYHHVIEIDRLADRVRELTKVAAAAREVENMSYYQHTDSRASALAAALAALPAHQEGG